jgi:hypothetical protein
VGSALGGSPRRRARGGRAAPAAAPDDAVFAEVDGLQVDGLERIRTLVHRSFVRWADLKGGRTYRLVHRTVENGLLMRVPRQADFPAPFALSHDVTRVAFRRGNGHQPDGRVSVEWFAMRVQPAGTIAP